MNTTRNLTKINVRARQAAFMPFFLCYIHRDNGANHAQSKEITRSKLIFGIVIANFVSKSKFEFLPRTLTIVSTKKLKGTRLYTNLK